MEVFRVRDRLIEDYREFTGSFVDIHDKTIREHVAERRGGSVLRRDRHQRERIESPRQQPARRAGEAPDDRIPGRPAGQLRPVHRPGVAQSSAGHVRGIQHED